VNPSQYRYAHDRAIIAVVAIVAAVGGILATTVAFGIVHNLETAGSLFSVMAVPIAVGIFYAARLLHQGIRRARLAALLDEDRRDREHVVSTINLCQHIATGASKSGRLATELRMSAMRHIATHITLIMSQYSHHLGVDGKRVVEDVRSLSFGVLDTSSCARADFADIAKSLSCIGVELLPLDDPQMEARRRRAAGIEDPPPE